MAFNFLSVLISDFSLLQDKPNLNADELSSLAKQDNKGNSSLELQLAASSLDNYCSKINTGQNLQIGGLIGGSFYFIFK